VVFSKKKPGKALVDFDSSSAAVRNYKALMLFTFFLLCFKSEMEKRKVIFFLSQFFVCRRKLFNSKEAGATVPSRLRTRTVAQPRRSAPHGRHRYVKHTFLVCIFQPVSYWKCFYSCPPPLQPQLADFQDFEELVLRQMKEAAEKRRLDGETANEQP
jgi:hypothetical protein